MTDNRPWISMALGGLAFLILSGAVALIAKSWVLTAIPVGFLFGFFLQKGDLCGASAFSEVLLARDGRKVFGLWVCIVVSMLGFALLDVLGLATLNPKPMLWVNYLVGGVLFGTGMVLAGGCVSGCLFKAPTGNLNSIAALIAMPVGIALVEYGPLHGLFLRMKSVKVSTSDGSALSLQTVTGIPYWLLAVIFAAGTVSAALLCRKGRPERRPETTREEPHLKRILTRPWKPWQAGLAIGLLAAFAYLSSAGSGRNYPLGVTHGVLQAELLLTDHNLQHVYQKPATSLQGPEQTQGTEPVPRKKVVWWLVLLVGGLVLGAFTSGKLSGQARLLPKPPEQTVWAILGGFLVGSGAAIATGCVIGNILSGWALMSLGMLLFGVVTILANWLTTYLYLMGGQMLPSKR